MDANTEYCQYFVLRKNRFCKMTVRKGQRYCGEHHGEEEGSPLTRIVCPLDNKHTCYAHMLQKHLKKCNAKLSNNIDYVIFGKNRGFMKDHEQSQKVTLATVDDNYLVELIRKIENVASDHIPLITEEIHKHPVLFEELNKSEYGIVTRQHLLQNASLLGTLSQLGLLESGTCFVEFGAGRGQLSYWIGEAMRQVDKSCILVPIDRASNRHKFDKRHRTDGQVIIQRLRVDIGDLDLGRVPVVKNAASVVALCKHLCGVGIDLALRCITGSGLDNIQGLVMASCCHHRAEWESYVGSFFLEEHGFNRDDFELMCTMASWATCGLGSSKKCATGQGFQRYSSLNITNEEREKTGFHCKRLLDTGRLMYLKSFGFRSNLIEYVDKAVSPENICLIGRLPRK